MKYPTIDLKTICLKPGESFTIKVEGFADTREVFVLLSRNNKMLSFNDEHFTERHNAQAEHMVLDKGHGWISDIKLAEKNVNAPMMHTQQIIADKPLDNIVNPWYSKE